ncbi:urea ABC transporter permease subunit UrtB [Marinicellulosiphila megalodicopiae]|uniref:urea ABC transporter permease subunit UrtB n=1 Tax=Marinicellulosiphila megalodicopiae TaxID=2724896 RepID=UPI003BAFB49F
MITFLRNGLTRSCQIACMMLLAVSQVTFADQFDEITQKLLDKDFDVKAAAIDELAVIEDERVRALFEGLTESTVYYIKKTNQIGYYQLDEKSVTFTTLLEGEVIDDLSKRSYKKITTNNALRGQIKLHLAALNILSKEADVRLTAIDSMLKSPDPLLLDILIKAQKIEQNRKVKALIELNIALIHVESENETERNVAYKVLSESLHEAARIKLTEIKDSETQSSENIKFATKALLKIEDKLKYLKFTENVFFGLSAGSVLLLSAIGLAITFGVMGVINMAHGEMIMIGAYTTYVVQLLMPDHIALSIVVAIPTAFLVSGLIGVIIERGIIQFLYGRPLETLLATFGVSLFLQQAVRSIFSALNMPVITPDWMSGSIEINDALSFTFNRLYIIIFALMVFIGLLIILKRTFFGLQMRAVTQNRKMARSMGIRSNWVDAMTFGLGSGIAGIAGVALSTITNVGPDMGQAYIIDSFMVVVFGGVGNLWGTFVAAMSLGVANKFIEPFAGAVLAKIIILVFIIMFIQKRPRGLFALKGRSVEG